MSLKGALDRICSNYDCGTATVSDGENDEDPSHGSQSDDDRAAGYLASQSNAILSAISQADDDDESSDEMAGAELEEDRNQRNLMAERNAKIMQNKWRRRGILCSEEEDNDESVILSQSKKNPYRRLAMQEQFTPPRKRSKTVVPETDDECEAGLNDPEEQSEEEKLMTSTLRRRYYQTRWQLVKKWSKDRHQEAEINRDIDAIMEQSLKDAGHRAEHVSKTKDTDRAYWKEAQVRCIAFFF
jgi:hypothetical protein